MTHEINHQSKNTGIPELSPQGLVAIEKHHDVGHKAHGCSNPHSSCIAEGKSQTTEGAHKRTITRLELPSAGGFLSPPANGGTRLNPGVVRFSASSANVKLLDFDRQRVERRGDGRQGMLR